MRSWAAGKREVPPRPRARGRAWHRAVHLDAPYDDAAWKPLGKDTFADLQPDLATAPWWIIDGNYAAALPIRFQAPDTLNFLDLPASARLRRILQCRLRHGRGQHQTIGVHNRITWDFIATSSATAGRGPRICALIAEHAGAAQVVVLRSRHATCRFLAAVSGSLHDQGSHRRSGTPLARSRRMGKLLCRPRSSLAQEFRCAPEGTRRRSIWTYQTECGQLGGPVTPTRPTPHTLERLAFIRYLYELGLSQAAQPEPASSTSVLSWHDAAELFLRLAADHLQRNLPSNVNFMDYWNQIKPAMPAGADLPGKVGMGNLNEIRRTLKHYGVLPSKDSIERSSVAVTAFFTEATELIFGLTFASIDLIDIVPQDDVKSYLRLADDCARQGDLATALGWLLYGFDQLVRRYIVAGNFRIGTLNFGGNVGSMAVPSDTGHDDLEGVVESLVECVGELQEAMQIVSLGISYADYARLYAIAPHIERDSDGYYMMSGQPGTTHSESDYAWARTFVVSSALTAARAEGLVTVLSTRTRPRFPRRRIPVQGP